MLKAAARFSRVLIRRPLAYRFRKQYPGVPIPGLVFLDGSGKLLGSTPLRADVSPQEVAKTLNEVKSQ
ncbi:MAG: hypothetical protein HYZ53_11120 [Planctomycetes bacterium]|nr:hypothetical protein [Planctomycetota bacterium]